MVDCHLMYANGMPNVFVVVLFDVIKNEDN